MQGIRYQGGDQGCRPWEYGALAAAGKRRGLDEAVDSVKAGVPLHEVAAEYSLAWVSHGKGLTSLRQMLKLDADRRSFGPDGPEVWVLWGPSGTGKSRWVAATWPDAFWKAPESKWWDGYSGQETVVLDDFKDYAMPLVELQRLLDWYPLWVEVKGGSVPMLAKRYVLTANTSPEDWYLKADVHRTIWRRVTDFAAKHGRLIHCVDGWTPPAPGAAGAEVPGNTEPQGQEPQPALGERYRPSDCQLALRLSELLIILPISAAASRGLTRPAYLLRLLCP